MKYFLIALGAVVFLLLLLIIFLFIYKKVASAKASKDILKYGRETENYISKLVKLAFNPKNVFRNIYLPKSAYNTDKVTEIDILLVTKAGIFVIEVKGSKGFIDNPAMGDWCQHYGEKHLAFHNPFEQNAAHIRAVSDVLKRDGIYNIPMHSVVVFADQNVKFKHRYENLTYADTLVKYLKDKSAIRSISNHEIHRVSNSIAANAVRCFGVKRKHIKSIKARDKKHSDN